MSIPMSVPAAMSASSSDYADLRKCGSKRLESFLREESHTGGLENSRNNEVLQAALYAIVFGAVKGAIQNAKLRDPKAESVGTINLADYKGYQIQSYAPSIVTKGGRGYKTEEFKKYAQECKRKREEDLPAKEERKKAREAKAAAAKLAGRKVKKEAAASEAEEEEEEEEESKESASEASEASSSSESEEEEEEEEEEKKEEPKAKKAKK